MKSYNSTSLRSGIWLVSTKHSGYQGIKFERCYEDCISKSSVENYFLDEPKPPNPIIAAMSGSTSGSSSAAFSFWKPKRGNKKKKGGNLWESVTAYKVPTN